VNEKEAADGQQRDAARRDRNRMVGHEKSSAHEKTAGGSRDAQPRDVVERAIPRPHRAQNRIHDSPALIAIESVSFVAVYLGPIETLLLAQPDADRRTARVAVELASDDCGKIAAKIADQLAAQRPACAIAMRHLGGGEKIA